MAGKRVLVFGVANERSIAWGISQALHAAGAKLGFTFLNEALERRVRPLAERVGSDLVLPCDATDEEQVAQVFRQVEEQWGGLDVLIHSIAFANREDLEGRFVDTGREGFLTAMEVSAYTLVSLSRAAAPLLRESGGNILAQTALRPLGIRHETDRGDFYLTIHPANVRADDGAVELFARVAQGQSVCAMEATVGELVGSLDRLIAEARADGGFEQNQPQAGVLIYCAGCAGAAGTELDAGLRQAWESSLPGVPLLGLCTYWSTPGGRATTCHNSSLGPPRVCDSTCTST